MNTANPYIRDTHRAIATEPQEPPSAVDPLAVHRDPSAGPSHLPATGGTTRSIAWIRPSELPTMVGTRTAGRVRGVHSDVARWARHAPAQVTRRAITRATSSPQSQHVGGPSI